MKEIEMNELETARKEIESIDTEMAELFERRMELSAVIGEYKAGNGLPVRDPEREKKLTERNLSHIKNGDLKPYYVEFLGKTIELSREYQQKLINEKHTDSGAKK